MKVMMNDDAYIPARATLDSYLKLVLPPVFILSFFFSFVDTGRSGDRLGAAHDCGGTKGRATPPAKTAERRHRNPTRTSFASGG